MAIPQRNAALGRAPRPGKPASASLQPVQARSAATREAMLAAGRSLLAEREFDALAIADLAAAIGMSVGSFYGRFQDKQAFFDELQTQVIGEWREDIARTFAVLREQQRPAAAVVVQACRLTVGLMRADSGFLRSALKHESTHPGSWTPVKQVARELVDELLALLAPLLTHVPMAQRAVRVRFAMQMTYGTCLTAVLHDPGPMALASRDLERELAKMMGLYLGLPEVQMTRALATRVRPNVKGKA